MYKKFPIGSVTTRLSGTRYMHLGEIARVDEHFIRFPKIVFQVALMPKAMALSDGHMKKSFRQNSMNVAGGGLRKSLILKKMLRKILINPSTDPTNPGWGNYR